MSSYGDVYEEDGDLALVMTGIERDRRRSSAEERGWVVDWRGQELWCWNSPDHENRMVDVVVDVVIDFDLHRAYLESVENLMAVASISLLGALIDLLLRHLLVAGDPLLAQLHLLAGHFLQL